MEFNVLKKIIMWCLGGVATFGFAANQLNLFSEIDEVNAIDPIKIARKITPQKMDSVVESTSTYIQNKLNSLKHINFLDVTENPKNVREPFWDFYYKFVADPGFRSKRIAFHQTETEKQFTDKVLIYGSFKNQDSLSTHWIYTINYKDFVFTYDYVIRDGKWYLREIL